MKLFLPFTVVFLFIVSACKKDVNKKVIKIEGFALKDNLGNQFGVIGNADDDWQLGSWSAFSSKEQSFLNFPDNIDLANTVITTLYNPVSYPNPVYNNSTISFRSDDSVKLKIAVVDAEGHVSGTAALKIKGTKSLLFDFSDSTQFPSGKSLRYYYSFSAASQQNFKAGYGDIKICRLSGVPVTACF